MAEKLYAKNFAGPWTLNGAHNNTTVTLTLNEVVTDAPPVPFPIVIESEVLKVTAVNTGTKQFTVVRGYDGTTAASHSGGASVKHEWPAGQLHEPVTVAGQTYASLSEQVLTFAQVNLASQVTGTLPIGNGGTGVTGTPANGQLLIGNGSGFALATLTGTSNVITVTNAAGTITLNAGTNVALINTTKTISGVWTYTGIPRINSGLALQNETVDLTGQASYTTLYAFASGVLKYRDGTGTIYTAATTADLTAHTGDTANPHSVTKAQVGLSNVENTALTTWAGSSSITTVGTLASGAVPWSLLTGVPSTFTPSAHTLDSHSNVTITAIAANEILKWSGTAWINNTLAEAGIAAASHTHAASEITSGTFADARIAASNVTQHQASLSIGWGQLTGVPTTFTPSTHTHGAGDITDGILAIARGGTGTGSSPTDGQVLIGSGGSWILNTITGTVNKITVTPGAGTIKIDVGTNIPVKTASEAIGGIWTFDTGIKIDNGLSLENEAGDLTGTAGYSTLYAQAGGVLKLRDGTGTIHTFEAGAAVADLDIYLSQLAYGAR